MSSQNVYVYRSLDDHTCEPSTYRLTHYVMLYRHPSIRVEEQTLSYLLICVNIYVLPSQQLPVYIYTVLHVLSFV